MQKKHHKKDVEKSKLEDTLKRILKEEKLKEKIDESKEKRKSLKEKDKEAEENISEETNEQVIEQKPFNEFLSVSTKSSAPVLENIAQRQATRLEQNVGIPENISKDENQEKEYQQITQNNLQDYSSQERNNTSQDNYEVPILKPIPERENFQEQILFKEEFFHQENLKNNDPEIIQAELIRETRKLPFEKQEFQYKKIKYKIQ